MSAPISFGFSKKVQHNKLVDSKLRDASTKEEKEEKDFVKLVVGNEIQGTLKKEEEQEWVVPLIKQNKWKVKDKKGEEDKDKSKSGDGDKKNGDNNSSSSKEDEVVSPEEALRRQAIKELLKEANNEADSDDEPDYEVPLLLQNRIPNGYEEEDNMDVSLRPEQSSLDDYDQFPIEKFGMAMLRGMGWKKQEGIGRTNKSVVELREPKLRPKGLGLGAERPNPGNKDAVPSNTKNNAEDSKLTMKIGAGALINKGENKGLYGQIESFDEDNNRVIMKLALNGKMAAVSKFHIDLVSPSEYKEKSKILNYEKYAKYKNAEAEENFEDERREFRNGKHNEEDNERLERDSRHYSSHHDNHNGSSSSTSRRKEYDDNHRDSASSSSSRRHPDRRERERDREGESISRRDRDRHREDRDGHESRHRHKTNDDDSNSPSEDTESKRKSSKKSKKEKKSKSRRRDRDSSDSSRERDYKKSHKRKHRDRD